MLKIVVYDSGYGGENFADLLEEQLPVVEVIRVIDWRHADQILASPKEARRCAREALEPYIGNVDLIIFANYLISITSIKYFAHNYKNQKFLGIELEPPSTFIKRNVLILTTKAVAKTMGFRNFVFQLRRKTKILTLDSWPAKIDDGDLTDKEIIETLESHNKGNKFVPEEIIIGCSQFYDIRDNIKKVYKQRIKIYDSFNDTIRKANKILKIRGGYSKKANVVK